nr:glycosyltransferase [Salinibacter ruber]
MFEAYARLRERMPEAPSLFLAGLTGPSDSAWEEAKSLGIAEHVDVHIDVPEEELARLYRNANLFVLSSRGVRTRHCRSDGVRRARGEY